MRNIILLSGIAAYLIVLLLFGKTSERMKRLSDRLLLIEKQDEITDKSSKNEDKSFFERILRPWIGKGISHIGEILPISDDSVKALNERLRLSGSYRTAREYIASHIAIMGLSLAGVFVYSRLIGLGGMATVEGMLLVVFAVYVLSRFKLSGNITKRKQSIETELPEVMDLLSVSVSAGLGFDQALLYVAERFNGPLVDELSVTQKEISLGKARGEALKRLSARCDVESLSIFVSSVVQAETLGIPMSNVLSAQADNIRNMHRQKVEERAAKLPVKILIPLVFLVFPNLFLIVLSPAVPGIIAAFGG